MRKITKLKLEELEEKLPVASETEMAECVGGAHYYVRESGGIYYAGEHGSGDELLYYTSGVDSFYNEFKKTGAAPSNCANVFSDYGGADLLSRKKIMRFIMSTNFCSDSPIKWFDYSSAVCHDYAITSSNNNVLADGANYCTGYYDINIPGPKVVSLYFNPSYNFTGSMSGIDRTIKNVLNRAGFNYSGSTVYMDYHRTGMVPLYTNPW